MLICHDKNQEVVYCLSIQISYTHVTQNRIRQREKTMRGLKTDNTPIVVEGHRLYYNFIKPHESLDGKTPSEEAGITIEGDNKWLTLMYNAVQYQKSKESC